MQRPRTASVIIQYLDVHQRVEVVVLDLQMEDRLGWRWTSSGIYSSSSAYEALFYGQSSVLGVKELWKSKAPGKCHFFLWLVLHGRSWTSDRLFRYGLWDDTLCAFCAQDSETLDHLLLPTVPSATRFGSSCSVGVVGSI
jgi:hypothetical protein